MNKKQAAAFVLAMGLTAGAWAANGQLSVGASFDAWNANYVAPTQDNGFEVYTPLSIAYTIAPQLDVFAQSEFAHGTYTDSTNGTLNLNNVSDTSVGGKLSFKSFGLNSVGELSLNLPTGDTSWESKAQLSEPPTQFIDSRYQGRGFGASAFYGISLPDGRGEYSVGAGYLYAGAYNPNYGTTTNLKLGDAIFGAINRVTPISKDENEIIRVSVYQSFPTYENGTNAFQLGTNFNAAYNWTNAKALSFEVGGQVYLPSSYNGVTEAHNSNGPRAYATGTYAFGDFTLTGRAKYIFQNDYPLSDPNASNNDGGGGLQLGIEPGMRFVMDENSYLKMSASLDDIWANNYGVASDGSLTTVNFLFWGFHSEYVWKL